MKDLTQYHFRTIEAFHKFLRNKDEEELMISLNELQRHYESSNSLQKTDKHIWFRLPIDSLIGLTINDIMEGLKNHNRAFIIESIEACVKDWAVEVYYS